EVPAGVGLSAYRIVQEALTNTLKHADARHARVAVRYRDSGLEVEVRDDGRGETNGDGDGHGLLGMRERALLLGGELEAGPAPDRVRVLTPVVRDEYVYEAIRAGASGFLLKDVQRVELVDAIRVVAAGNALFGPTATQRLIERFGELPKQAPPSLDALTDREREILRLLAGGLSNAELAERLFVSETTVKSHVSSVLRKLGVRDRVQAVIAAYDAGLVRPGVT